MDEEELTLVVNEDIILEQVQSEHADNMYALIEQEGDYLRKWVGDGDLPGTLSEVHDFIFTSTMRFMMNGAFDAGIWVAGQLAGMVSLQTINPEKRRTGIGYWLGREYQGRGIMTQSVNRVVVYAFQDYQLDEIKIYCATGNAKSRADAERCDFRFERVIPQAEKIDGVLHDQVVYGLRRRQWKEMQSKDTP